MNFLKEYWKEYLELWKAVTPEPIKKFTDTKKFKLLVTVTIVQLVIYLSIVLYFFS